MRCRIALLLGLILAGSPVRAGTVLFVDPPKQANTVVFRDYAGSSDTNVRYHPGGASNFPSQTVAGGTSTWTYSAAVSDPKIIYEEEDGAVDHATYPWMRMRYRQSKTNGLNVWELPAQGGRSASYQPSTAFVEDHHDIPNPEPEPSGQGFRIDPFGSTAVGDSFTADYLMLDRFETIGLGEWDRDGDLEGWSLNHATADSVAGSLLSGRAGSGSVPDRDAQVIRTGLSVDGSQFPIVEARMQADAASAQIQLFWGNSTDDVFSGSRRVDLGDADGQFHTYLIDFRDDPAWFGQTITRLRLDPVNAVDNAAFQIDYVRLRADAVVPEPSTLALGALGLAGIATACLGRRRTRPGKSCREGGG